MISVFLPTVLLWIAAMILLYLFFDKEYRVSFHEKYSKSLPADYPPGIMAWLVGFGRLERRDLVAALLHLVSKEYLSTQRADPEGGDLSAEQKDIILKYGKNQDYTKLLEHERYLLDWFMVRLGQCKCLHFFQACRLEAQNGRAPRFAEDYKGWEKAVKTDAAAYGFFCDKRAAKAAGFITGLVFIGFSLYQIIPGHKLQFALTAGLGFVSIFYSSFIQKRSLKGQEQYEKWMAFKRYMRDFRQEEREGSLSEWEQYLAYALSLGVAREVLGGLYGYFTEEEWKDPALRLLNQLEPGEEGLASFYTMLETINSEMEKTIMTGMK